MKNNIEFSIVIPTFNEERDLKDCLLSISKQTYPKNKFEIIIVDNFSKDKTLEVASSFSKIINLIIVKNKIKDAEVSKMIGFKKSKGKFFMYLDADMRFADKNFIEKMLYPFKNDKKIAGNFVQFLVNKKHPSLTRALSYDEWQRDPIFRFFTKGIKDIIYVKKEKYWLCKCDENNVPPQGLMIYKKDLIKNYVKDKKQLIDNEIPAVLVKEKHIYFAFVPDTGVHHLLVRNLKELSRKRIRNLERTYFPNKETRKFRWIEWKKDWPKVGIWIIYTNSIIFSVLIALIKSLKYRDSCFLTEPALNIVSTYSIIYAITKNKIKKNE